MTPIFQNITFLTCLILLLEVKTLTNAQNADLEVHHLFKPEVCHRKSKATDMLTLHYKGYMPDGEVFDSSWEGKQPLTFQVGIGHVIKGWDRGLIGVCEGEKRKLVVPPHLGYGDMKHEQIPPGSTLMFDIEILKIEDGPAPINVFKEIDTDNDNKLSKSEISQYLKKQIGYSKEGDLGSQEDPNQVKMVQEIFDQEDVNKDDYITHEEFSGPKHDHVEL